MLVTRELAEKLPPINHFADAGADAIPVIARFTDPKNDYYPWEYDPQHKRFYGLVKGREVRVGFFTVRSMEGRYARPDDTWETTTLSELADKFGVKWLKERR
jgi:hypothetical protein